MKYVVVDPSGSFSEGKGHTGMAYMQEDDWASLETISVGASAFDSRHHYWTMVRENILGYVSRDPENTIVIIESFMIRNNGFLIGSMPETIRLIGFLEYELEARSVRYTFQTPSQAKARFKDNDLCRCIPGMSYKSSTNRYYLNGRMCNDHVRDALKHLLYFKRYQECKICTTRNP